MLEILVQTGNDKNLFRPLDLNPDTVFTINYEIASVKDIADSGGAYTKTITVPDTKANRQIFGYISNLSVDLGNNYYSNLTNSFNPNKRYRCTVLENSMTVLEGYLQLKQMTFDFFRNSKQYEITIYADNANFYQSLGDDLLTDLDFSEYNFKLSPSAITASWTNDIDAYKLGYYASWVDNGNGYTIDDINTGKYVLTYKDVTPGPYVKTIWDKIVSSKSYNVVSDFIGSDNHSGKGNPDPRFGNLFIPYTQQRFENASGYNQNKIFHVGLGIAKISQYSLYTAFGYYLPKYYWTMDGVVLNKKVPFWNPWNGYLLSPFQDDPGRNSNATSSFMVFTQSVIPFGLTATPMFNTINNGENTFDTNNYYYKNTTGEIFKQRFILKTDVVVNYTMDDVNLGGGGGVSTGFCDYQMSVNFYREINPITGTTSPSWASGLGAIIPPDLGGAEGLATDDFKFWIADLNGRSNVFTGDGNLLVLKPYTATLGGTTSTFTRYLGKYCTSENGSRIIEADNGGDTIYRRASGDCVACYYNDGYNDTVAGLWFSGTRATQSVNVSSQPFHGDWMQDLTLQSIWLDGDTTHPKYGASGSYYSNANMPIQPGERVRCVVKFASRYKGQFRTSLDGSYKPPVAATLVSYTGFTTPSGIDYDSRSHLTQDHSPLTVFYNEVSPEYITGQEVKFNDLIPKNVKQRDFVQDIVRMHNLYIEPKKNNINTLIVEPREDYYKLGNGALDWTSKIDLTTPIQVQVLAETQNKTTLFTYKKDNDWYNKQYTQLTNETYGQYKNVIDNDFLTGEKKIESIFSPTPLVQLVHSSTTYNGSAIETQGGFIIPVLVNGANVTGQGNAPTNFIQTNYRILYKNVISNLNGDTVKLFGKDTHIYPYGGMYDNPYQPTYGIVWGQTLGEFFKEPTDQFYSNLVTSYWVGLLTELTNIDSKLITLSMYLTPYDIANFHFYDIIFLTIDGVDGYYKVNSIEDYIPGQNSVCKVTLLKSSTAALRSTFVPNLTVPTLPPAPATPAPPDNPVS